MLIVERANILVYSDESAKLYMAVVDDGVIGDREAENGEEPE